MIPIGVPANGLVAANQQQGMRMEFRGIVQNRHELRQYSDGMQLYCIYCGELAGFDVWQEILGMPDDTSAHIP